MAENSTKLRGLKYSNEEANRISCESLETALIQLLGEKDIDEISIEELVRRAGVSRMAYYRNFGAKDAILNNVVGRVCTKIEEVMEPHLIHDDWVSARQEMFRVLYEYKDFCRVLVAAHESERLQNFFNDFAAKFAYDDSERERYRMYFWAGATYNLMYEWLKDDMKISPDELADYCNTASLPRE